MKESRTINRIYTYLKHGCYQRTLHYHNTPKKNEELYRKQLAYMKENYEVLSPKQAYEYLQGKETSNRPSIIIGAFDGYRNNYEVLWKLLETYELKAWFLLVTDFLDTPADEQKNLLLKYKMQWYPEEYADGRYAMRWDEAKEIAQTQVIVNHTSTHYMLTENTPEEILQYEIEQAHEKIVKEIGKRPEIISWLGGAGLGKNKLAEEKLRKLGYHFQIGQQLEYFDDHDRTDIEEEQAVPDGTEKCVLAEEVRRQEALFGNIGWYSAVPAILPFYQRGYMVTDKERQKDIEMAKHFASLAYYLQDTCRLNNEEAAQQALDVLAVNRIGEGFPFY